MKTMLMAKLRAGVVVLAAGALAATGTGLVAHRVVAAGGQQQSRADGATPNPPDRAGPTDEKAQRADAEMHVVGVYWSKAGRGDRGPVTVEVRPTAKPVVLVLTSYFSVDWHVKAAAEVRIQKVIVSGYFAQEIKGLPAGVPVVNQSYFPDDGSRRKDGWFFAYQWNTPQWREMVRRLNDAIGLPVASFQSAYEGESFVVDGRRGRDLGQKELKPRAPAPKEPTPQELLAASARAELHVVGSYSPDGDNPGKPLDVEVRATAKPVVLVLASYLETVWNVKVAEGARLKAVIVGGYFPQEIDGLPADVPVCHFCPDASTIFGGGRSRREAKFFYAYKWNTIEYRRMVERLNDLTGLLVSTFQGESRGTSFVVDGTRGRDFGQTERKDGEPRVSDPAKKQPKPEEDPLADVADIPSQELRAAGDADKRYFLIGPKKEAKPPAEGYGLVVILPGGDGSADFHPFVKRIYKNALFDQYVAAQPIAPKWTPDQEIVWPTKTNPVTQMKFGTEEFVEAVIENVAKKHQLDRTRVFTLSWSSSGPAAYATSLQDRRGVTGSLIAMSVFNPKYLPPLKGANGHAYYLYHSPQDRVCPYRMAEQARNSLAENGAKVRLETYEGGHGWRGDVYHDIRNGVEWLEKNRDKASQP